MAARSVQADKPGTYVHNEHLWSGLPKAVVQVNLPPAILPFTKHLWLQFLIPVNMSVSLSDIIFTDYINH